MMFDKAKYRSLAFICLIFMLLLVASNMFAQDSRARKSAFMGKTGKEEPVFIRDEPGDSSRWAAIRDIFMSPADRKKSTAPGLISPSDDYEGDDPDAPETAEAAEKIPQLRGILVAGRHDYTALFNDNGRDLAVKKGDSVYDFVILKITRNSVTLEKNGKEIVLYVQE
jgi:hypothetical protein